MAKTKTEQHNFFFENGTPIAEGCIPYKIGKSWHVKVNDTVTPVFSFPSLSQHRLKYANGAFVADDAVVVEEGRRRYVIDPAKQSRVEVFTSAVLSQRRLKYANGSVVADDAVIVEEGGCRYVIDPATQSRVEVFTAVTFSHRRLKYANGSAVADDAVIVEEGGRRYVLDPARQSRVEVFTTNALSQRCFRSKNVDGSQDEAESLPNLAGAVAGISDKYQLGRVARLPMPLSTYETGAALLACFPSCLELVKLHERMVVARATSLVSLPIVVNGPGLSVRLQLYTHKPLLSPEDRLVFIFSGRKEQAYIPHAMPGDEHLRVILVGPREDYERLESHLQEGVDFLVIDELVSPTHGQYAALGLVVCRRIAAFYCALYLERHCGANHALMLDDNIRSVHVEGEEIICWDKLFTALIKEADKRQSLSVSLATLTNQGVRDVRDGELGSKFYLFALKRLRVALGDDERRWCLPFPPKLASNFWGEDYFFQMMFEALGASASLKGYETLDPCRYGIRRASLPSLCRAVVKKADEWCQVGMDGLFGAGLAELDVRSYRLINHVVESFKKLIQENVRLYQARLQHSRTQDLMIAHAWANNVSYHPEMPIAPIADADFLRHLGYQIMRIKELGHLHGYQKEILEKLCAYLDKERFIGQINMATGTGKSYVQIYLAIAALLTGSRRPVVIVTPYQQLVQQLHDDFLRVLQSLGELPISICQVLKVDSEESSITAKNLLQNRTLDGKPCILLFCGSSFREIQESRDEAMKPYQYPSMLLVDESHLQRDVAARIHQHEHDIRHSFIAGLSATPKSKQALWRLDGCVDIRYTRTSAVAHDYLAPCILDRFAMPYSSDAVLVAIKAMPTFLRENIFPTGGMLSEKKIIIYVPDTDKVQNLNYSRLLKESLDRKGLASCEINSDEPDSKKNLASYKRFLASECPTKILICKGMAKVGFSDPEVESVICLRNAQEDEFAQLAGRAMRLARRRKVAYVIGFSDVKAALVFQENLCCADEKALACCAPAYLEQRTTHRGIIELREDTPLLAGDDGFYTDGDTMLTEETISDDEVCSGALKRHGLFAESLSKRSRHNATYNDKIRDLEKEVSYIHTSYGKPSFPYEDLWSLKDELSALTDVDLKTRLLSELLEKVVYPLVQISPKSRVFVSAIEAELEGRCIAAMQPDLPEFFCMNLNQSML